MSAVRPSFEARKGSREQKHSRWERGWTRGKVDESAPAKAPLRSRLVFRAVALPWAAAAPIWSNNSSAPWQLATGPTVMV